MAHLSTPGQSPASIFGDPGTAQNTDSSLVPSHMSTVTTSFSTSATPTSAASSSNNTYIMPNSPAKARSTADGYRPKVTRTLGQRPACLVNASVTYCGDNRIYAFGGFDQYTDEVYNHVLKLDLDTHQWSLVDNYGDIPGVRMGTWFDTTECRHLASIVATSHQFSRLANCLLYRSYRDPLPKRQAARLWR